MLNWLSQVRYPRAQGSGKVPPSSPPHTKAQPTSFLSLHAGGQAAWTPRNYSALVKQGYERNPIVYRCIRMIAEAAASAPMCINRNGTCLEMDPAQKLLKSPHPFMSATEFFEEIYGYLLLSGNAYCEAALIDDVPAALYALRPDRMSVIPGKDGWPIAWEYQTSNFKRRFGCDRASGRASIVHMRLFNPGSDHYGFSPLEAAAQAIDLHNQGGVWAKALLDNSARPSGALIYKGQGGSDRLSPDQFERLKAELEGAHSGPLHAGRPLLLEGGLEWKPMGLTPQDMDFTTARREASREISLAFGVPPMLLGIPGDNTYANYKEANQAFWRQTVMPLTRKLAQSLEGWLQPWFGEDLNVHVDFDQVPALIDARTQLWSGLAQADFLTDEEKRSIAGMAPL